MVGSVDDVIRNNRVQIITVPFRLLMGSAVTMRYYDPLGNLHKWRIMSITPCTNKRALTPEVSADGAISNNFTYSSI